MAPRTIGRRGPRRAVSRPAKGATAKMPTLAGNVRRPASNAEYRCTSCKNCTRKKSVPIIAKPRTTLVTFATQNTRLANRCKGIIGSRTLASTSRKAESPATEQANRPRIKGEVHPAAEPSIRAMTRQKRLPVISTWPGRSMRRACGSRDSARPGRLRSSTKSPTGRFT